MIKFLNKTYAQTRTAASNKADVFVDEMTGPQLVELYRLVCSNMGKETRVTRFSDAKTGIKRVWGVLEEYAAEEAADAGEQQAPAVELTEADKQQVKLEAQDRKAAEPKEPKARKPRGMRFVFPVGDEIKEVRPGTNRAKLVELFTTGKGVTFDEALAATWGAKGDMDAEVAKKTCYEAIRLLHYYVGYGMKQDADGRITIHK